MLRTIAGWIAEGFGLVLIASFVPGATTAAAKAAELLPSPLPLAWCVERATERNPEVLERAALADAARERRAIVSAFDDPRFQYEASNIPVGDFDFESTPLSGHQFGLRQKFPMPGLLSARGSQAERTGRAAALEYEDRRRMIEGAVERAWARLGFAQRALGITDRNIETLGQLAEITEARYSVGAGPQQDVLRAQVELTTRLQERLSREAALASAQARIASLLDLSPTTPIPQTDSLADGAPVPALDSLYARARGSNAQLAALRERVAAAQSAVRAAKLAGLPDVDVGVGYRLRQKVMGDVVEGDDFVSAGVTLRLPVNRSRWRARETEQRALLRAAKARLRKRETSLESELRMVHAELVRADREAELLHTGLVPQALQSLESSRTAYEVGRLDFLGLLDSQVRLLTAQLQEVRAVSDRRAAFGVLEALVGEDLR